MNANLLLIPILLIGTCVAQTTPPGDLNDLISSIFDLGAGLPSTENTTPLIINPVPVTTTTTTTTRRPIDIPNRVQPVLTGEDSSGSYKKCGEAKECVREYLCSSGRVNTDGATLIDIRIDDDAECPFLQTCCAVGDKVDTPIIRPVETPTACGYRNIEGVGFKIEGKDNEAQFAEFPWMVAILRVEQALDRVLNVYQCGGSLLTPQVVLTGAHCVQARPANSFKIRAGEWETNSKTEIFPDQDRDVVEMIVHENYNKGSLYNDIALLFVDKPFDLAPNVNTVCLPPANSNFDSSRCFATGWGKDQFQNGEYQNVLKKIDLPIVPNAQCQKDLRNTRLGRYFELHRSFMCAGGELGKDTCKGDGGSPLVCPINNDNTRFYQAGIVAWGIGCGDQNVPGVYANVPHLRGWIDEQLAYKRIDPTYYTADLKQV